MKASYAMTLGILVVCAGFCIAQADNGPQESLRQTNVAVRLEAENVVVLPPLVVKPSKDNLRNSPRLAEAQEKKGPAIAGGIGPVTSASRSEERRVGKEW